MPLPSSLLKARHEDLDLQLLAGSWPDDLAGEVFISAPAASRDLSYALFGFGVMIRLSLQAGTHGAAPDRFAWRTQLIDSPTRRLYERIPDAFVSGPLGYGSALGAPNMANTAPLPWGDRLLATWDVGRPIELDPVTLRCLGEVGRKDTWGGSTFPNDDVLPFIFSSAHPVVDPERGCLWTVKLEPGSLDPFAWQPSVVRYDGDGVEVRRWPVAGARLTGSMHTVAQTRDWLVLADSGNFKADPGEMATGVRTVQIDEEVPVYLVRKDVLDATPTGQEVTATCCTLAPTTGHYYACYDDSDGIRVLFEHMDLMDLGYHLRADDRDATGAPVDPELVGMYNMAMAPSSASEVTIDPVRGTLERTAVHRPDWGWNQQLSALDWSTEGMTAPTRHHLVYQGWRPGAVTRRALDAYADRVGPTPGEETPGRLVSVQRGSLEETACYEFPSLGDLPTSPAFAPRRAGADPRRSRHAGRDPGGHDGYVVCPVLNDDGLRVEVFDAADVGRGPVATLGAPGRPVPVLLHSAWAPAAVPAPDHERLAFADDVTAEEIAALPAELAGVVRQLCAESST